MIRSTALLMFLVLLSATAFAKEHLSAQDRADQWVKQQINRTPDMVDDPFSVVTDVTLGRTPSAEMGKILERIKSAMTQEWELSTKSKRKRHDKCGVTAVIEGSDMASSSALSEIGRGFGAIAGDNLTASKGLAKKMLKTLGEKAMEQFTKDVLSELRKARPEDFKNNLPTLGHDVEMRVVWIKSVDRYEFYINGKSKKNADKLGRWSIAGSGTIVPTVVRLGDGKKEIRYKISEINPLRLKIAAQCPDEPAYTNDCGDPWVGVGAKPPKKQTCKPTPKPVPMVKKEKTDPLRPTYQLVTIPEVPGSPLCEDHLDALGEKVAAQLRIAEDNRNAARSAVGRIEAGLGEKQPNVSPAMLEQAELDFKEHEAVWRRARQANDQVLEKYNSAVNKKACSEEPVGQAKPKFKKVCKKGGGMLGTMNCVTIRIDQGG